MMHNQDVEDVPLLSIITPAYNAQSVLQAAIDSLRPQFVAHDAEATLVEWIIVDDGSTDSTASLIDGLAQDMAQVQPIHMENAGAGNARNVGISRARGTWLMFLDADDYLLPGSLMQVLSCLQRVDGTSDTAADIIYTPRTVVDMEGNNPRLTEAERDFAAGMPALEFWTSLYRKDFITDNGILFPSFREQDVETAFRFLAFNKTSRIVVDNSLKFYAHRDNPASNVHTWDDARHRENLFYVKALVYARLLEELPDAPRTVHRTISGIMYSCIDRYLMMAARRQLQVDIPRRLARILSLGHRQMMVTAGAETTLKKLLYAGLAAYVRLRSPWLGRKET